jgi:hypothetical protein
MSKSKERCKYCDREYDEDEVARKYGELSNVFVLGYCSAYCYTQDTVVRKEGAKK